MKLFSAVILVVLLSLAATCVSLFYVKESSSYVMRTELRGFPLQWLTITYILFVPIPSLSFLNLIVDVAFYLIVFGVIIYLISRMKQPRKRR